MLIFQNINLFVVLYPWSFEIDNSEIRKRYLNNQITRALGVDVDDVPTIPQIGKIFNQDFITDLFQDPARFELIFGKESQTNFKKIVVPDLGIPVINK